MDFQTRSPTNRQKGDSKNMNMPSSFQIVINHFKRNGWGFQLDANRPLLYAGFRGQNGNFRCVAFVEEADDLVQVVSFVPVVVPSHKLNVVAELCIRLSHGMKMGRFELDHAKGELRFHTSSPYLKGDLRDEVFQRVLGVNLVMVDQHFTAVIDVIYGNVSPAEAVSQVRAKILKPRQAEPVPEVQTPSRISFN